MILAIDIGNTNTVVGIYQKDQLLNHWRFASRNNRTSDEAGILITGLLERSGIQTGDIKKAVIASVVPQLTSVYQHMSEKYFNCQIIMVSPVINLPVKIDVAQPEQVGADRIANAAAGFNLYGGEVIIVDFGTATTFDVINAKGAYIGGVIIPGPQTALADLARKAARLFEVTIEPPDKIVGNTTRQALQSGMFYGTIGQIDYITEKILAETGFAQPTIVATGGLARGIETHSKYIRIVNPVLTLEGLRLIGEMN